MNDEKKPQPPVTPRPANESHDFGEAMLKRQINNTDTTTVSFRVPITPSPTRPPDRDKNE